MKYPLLEELFFLANAARNAFLSSVPTVCVFPWPSQPGDASYVSFRQLAGGVNIIHSIWYEIASKIVWVMLSTTKRSLGVLFWFKAHNWCQFLSIECLTLGIVAHVEQCSMVIDGSWLNDLALHCPIWLVGCHFLSRGACCYVEFSLRDQRFLESIVRLERCMLYHATWYNVVQWPVVPPSLVNRMFEP